MLKFSSAMFSSPLFRTLVLKEETSVWPLYPNLAGLKWCHFVVYVYRGMIIVTADLIETVSDLLLKT